jgi:hypothetical protein
MLNLVLMWFALLVALIFLCMRDWRYGGALVVAYFLSLSLIHVPGVLPYAVSQFVPGADATEKGFQLTVIGFAAFVVGAVCSHYSQPKLKQFAAPSVPAMEKFSIRAMITGVVSYFILIPIASRAPSLTSLLAPLGTLLVIGFWLRFYAAAQHGDLEKSALSLLLLPLLPLSTLSTAGFIGYGVNWVISVLSFFFAISKRRLAFYVLAPIVAFVGLSFFVAYIGERDQIRDAVWYENASVGDRFARIGQIFTDFEPLDLTSDKHIRALDARLNQNILVGDGMQRHDLGLSPFLFGGTVPVWAVVPRAFWPDKPEIGGGGELVSSFTGITFANGTSVGAGQVLEFYMNFGYPGVIIGFLALGYSLMWLDRGIMDALRSGNLKLLLRCAMPGLSMLQPGGNLMEIAIATIASVVGAYVITSFKVFGVPAPRTRPVAV